MGNFDQLTLAKRGGVLAARDAALLARIRHLKDLAARAEASPPHRKRGGLVPAELIGRAQRERAWIEYLARLVGEPQ